MTETEKFFLLRLANDEAGTPEIRCIILHMLGNDAAGISQSNLANFCAGQSALLLNKLKNEN